MAPHRSDRLSKSPVADQRSAFQRDRDRILYSTAFRRLAGVTQVVSPGEGEIFHNRLTHTIKVAQIARRLAEKFLQDSSGVVAEWGEIDPEVTEAAALAHDLGHPPFGHLAEEELNALVAGVAFRTDNPAIQREPTKEELKQYEGYEGNAQSFRILTTLSVRGPEAQFGLDLTRATLNASLKYPWLWATGKKKYGAYSTENVAFKFAREGYGRKKARHRCIEAQIMDWADDITYAIHDAEDFYRGRLDPVGQDRHQ